MVDSSYVSLFLYQNIFKGLQKKGKKKGTRKKAERDRTERTEEPGVSWPSTCWVSLNSGVGVVHAVCERPWVQLSVLSMLIVLLCYHDYE